MLTLFSCMSKYYEKGVVVFYINKGLLLCQIPGRVMKGNGSLIPLGFHSFISHTDLRPNYLKNDCLKLRVKKVVLY